MKISIKDHPFYVRMKQYSPNEMISDIVGDQPLEKVDKITRKMAFREIAKRIMRGRAERAKHNFNSDTNAEIARSLEWAFNAGIKSVSKPKNNFSLDKPTH